MRFSPRFVNMRKGILSAILAGCFITSVGQTDQTFKLQDFYSENAALSAETEEVFNQLNPEERVAQMIIASLGKQGKPFATVEPLIQQRKIGGIIFLSGDPQLFKDQISQINQMAMNWPLLMSMDAEPSLFNRRMPGTPPMLPTSELKSPEQISEAVHDIDRTLKLVGFQQNFAPVVDLSAANVAIGNRTFGSDSATVVPKALQFIEETQRDQIVATAKHFPGHGRVEGDTHKQLVYINGKLTEANLYKPLIDAGVLSIMVGHIAIENNELHNTDGMPSTLSAKVVTELLRNDMNFKGIIITDAMNMGAVASIPDATLLAAKAGCDMILMPPDELGTLSAIMVEMNENEAFKSQVHDSVKRIIRLKLCLGMHY